MVKEDPSARAASAPKDRAWGTTYASYASSAAASRGRLFDEPRSSNRTDFQRDRDRIIHCAAFRRLKQKTQVFVAHEVDHYRTRLTHSLEVAQIARTLSRTLGLNDDLAETCALAHDLGHTPFGHAGEDALNACMAEYGGFDHNAQTLRIVTRLERKYAEFDGLNLTWETLEGVVKHNGPLVGPGAVRPDTDVPEPILEYNRRHDLELDTWPSAEAQVAALSDDIAYNNHDIDDGLRAGLFSLADVEEVPLVGRTVRLVRDKYGELERSRMIHETIRRLIDIMVTDLATETFSRMADLNPSSADDIRRHDGAVVAFSDAMRREDAALREFLYKRMYRHYKVNRMTSKARRIVTDLFRLFVEEPELLPTDWQERLVDDSAGRRARLVADYIAGMTDSFALNEHHRLFDPII